MRHLGIALGFAAILTLGAAGPSRAFEGDGILVQLGDEYVTGALNGGFGEIFQCNVTSVSDQSKVATIVVLKTTGAVLDSVELVNLAPWETVSFEVPVPLFPPTERKALCKVFVAVGSCAENICTIALAAPAPVRVNLNVDDGSRRTRESTDGILVPDDEDDDSGTIR